MLETDLPPICYSVLEAIARGLEAASHRPREQRPQILIEGRYLPAVIRGDLGNHADDDALALLHAVGFVLGGPAWSDCRRRDELAAKEASAVEKTKWHFAYALADSGIASLARHRLAHRCDRPSSSRISRLHLSPREKQIAKLLGTLRLHDRLLGTLVAERLKVGKKSIGKTFTLLMNKKLVARDERGYFLTEAGRAWLESQEG